MGLSEFLNAAKTAASRQHGTLRRVSGRRMEKQRLNIARITPGMKLAEPVTNSAGITLMPAGIRLTPLFINRLQKWNVEALEVFVEKERESVRSTRVMRNRPASSPTTAIGLTAEQEEFARQVATEVAKRFVNVKENPLMMELRAVAIRRLIAHGKDGPLNRMFRAGNSTRVEAKT